MDIVIGLGAVALSTAVLLVYLLVIWWMDRYEREPLWLVGLTFLWGALGSTCLGVLANMMLNVPVSLIASAEATSIFSTVVGAPLGEEFAKALIFIVLVLTPHLDNETDGLIYGAAAGLGFATAENLLYFYSAAADGGLSNLLFVVVLRTLFSALGHTISTAIFGYFIGFIRHRQLFPWHWLLVFVGFGLAVTNHAFWNLCATLSSPGLLGKGSIGFLGLGALVVILMAILMFVLTQLSLWREARVIARYLQKEAELGTLPRAHATIIPSWRKRRKAGWLAAGVPRDQYIKTATLLAFRLYQADTAAPSRKAAYQQRVEESRQRMRAFHP